MTTNIGAACAGRSEAAAATIWGGTGMPEVRFCAGSQSEKTAASHNPGPADNAWKTHRHDGRHSRRADCTARDRARKLGLTAPRDSFCGALWRWHYEPWLRARRSLRNQCSTPVLV